MGSLGMPEIVIILVIALIVFGPRKLPELGKTLGKSLAQFRRASEDFKRQWDDEVTIERQRIEAPAPAPVEHASYSAAESAGSEEIQTSASEAPIEHTSYSAAESAGSEVIQTSTSEEPLHIPTAGEAPVAAHHEETAAHETKRDWM
jgi:sec-independent protein translocase protein TatA